MRRSVSDDRKMIVCVCNRKGRTGGVGRDGSQKTRTPHRDVGNMCVYVCVR